MSAIAGVVRLDGARCEERTVERLASLVAHRAHDGISTWCQGPAGLVHGHFSTTPQDRREHQPIAEVATDSAITFDGRIDNRGDLFDALAIAATDRDDIGDAALVLRSYHAFGTACAERLLGDFAFAIWDGRARRLFGARDHFGLKPFCYRASPDRFAFASEPGALARYDGDRPAVNEAMVAEHLSGVVTSRTETLYSGILRLPAAHQLIADANGVRLARYWAPDLCAENRFATRDDYATRLRELIEQAVAARLRIAGGVAVSLSGGVDSSSITGISVTLCRRHAVDATDVAAFSLQAGDHTDESQYWSQVADRWGIDSTTVPAPPLPAGLLQEEARRFADLPNMPNAAYTDRLRHCMRARGYRVALNGGGADDWLGVSPWGYADLLRRGQMIAFARRLRFDAAETDFIGWRAVAKTSVWPLLPHAVKRIVRGVLRRGAPPPWIDCGLATRVGLRERLERHMIDLPHTSWERYDTWHQAFSGGAVHQYELIERSSAYAAVDMWYPFMDRRILEFGLAVPFDIRWHEGRQKEILRRAMAPYLPPAVAERRTSPPGTHLLLEGLDTEGGRALFERPLIGRLGWVDQATVLARYDRALAWHAAGDARYHWYAVTLWRVAAVELWARAMQDELCLNS